MSIPEVMKGVQLTGHGGPEKLLWNEAIPAPKPGPGEVLVKVLAAGVNNTDVNTRIGWYSREIDGSTDDAVNSADVESGGWAGALHFPRIQGGDLCGKVVGLGPDVRDVRLGMRVICPTNQPDPTAGAPTRFLTIGSEFDGAFAQYCAVSARQLHDVSEAPLTDLELGAIPCAFGTAYNLLDRSAVGPEDHVLITGASGGVGLAAVQLAKLRGAKITGVASTSKHDVVREAGASELLDRNQPPPPQSVTVVIDIVGGIEWPRLIEALKLSGRYATSGAIARPIVSADLRTLYLSDLTFFGCSYTPHDVFSELVALINQKHVKPLVSKTYPLEDIALAQADFLAKRYPGKLVLIPPRD
jgi:alcohol dehydrogenase